MTGQTLFSPADVPDFNLEQTGAREVVAKGE